MEGLDFTNGFPKQQLPFSRKTKSWGRACVDWAAERTYFNYAPVRRGVVHMKINYDLVEGRLHMRDVAGLLNPSGAEAVDVPERIQHYPIINSYLTILEGEAGSRRADWRAVVTNPDSVSAIEEERRREFDEAVRSVVEDTSVTDCEAQDMARDVEEWFDYKWQDVREVRANEIINHYSREQDFRQTFLQGFRDAEIVGEECYLCDIVGGEPTLTRLNPRKLRIYRSGYGNRIEDADVVVYEDYWSPGKVLDNYYDQLTAKEVAALEDGVEGAGGWEEPTTPEGAVDDSYALVRQSAFAGEEGVELAGGGPWPDMLEYMDGGHGSDLNPYDSFGNVRVVRVYWKSRRKLLKVKSYDPETGEERFDFYPESYVPDATAGEEATSMWVNEAWEGTKVGKGTYVNVRPRPVQFNTLDSPCRCHFGIIGTVYNVNEGRPLSLVDIMKPYNYLYDAVAHKMVELIADNWGNLLEMDLALVPEGWEVDKWLYFARTNKVVVKNSYNEGSKGASTGVLAGGLNNASKGVINADWGQSIQYYCTLLSQIKSAMGEVVGISPQRLGTIRSTETVGGVERSTLQSSYITEWLFQQHDDTVRRVMAAFLETAKAAFRGRTKKFPYILSDKSVRMMEVDGDEFAESDYGIVMDNSADSQRFEQQVETLAQAALQNSVMDFASIMKLYTSKSLSEKARIVESAERRMRQRQESAQRQQQEIEERKLQAAQEELRAKMEHEDALNRRDNETKVRVAEINSKAEWLRFGQYADDENTKEAQAIEREKLSEQARQFDAELARKEREARQQREIELKKIQASKEKAGRTNNSGNRR